MLVRLKALVSTILLSTAAFGLCNYAPGYFGPTDEAPDRFEASPSLTKGFDVSPAQPNIDWKSVVSQNYTYVYIRATEGSTYKSPQFSSQYTGATNAHLIRGGYHFALPDHSSGAAQALWFISNGGGWTGDGITLPGALYMQNNPYGATCYGLSVLQMVNWIGEFSNSYRTKTGRYPVIYTSLDWWEMCTDNSYYFGINPLWIASYAKTPGTLPSGWPYYTFWQYANHGPVPGDQNYYYGELAGLKQFVKGT